MTKTDTSRAAAALGRLGGKAGRGAKKARSAEHYQDVARRSAAVRRALAILRAAAPDGSLQADTAGQFVARWVPTRTDLARAQPARDLAREIVGDEALAKALAQF